MDVYRHLYGPLDDCASLTYLRKIYQVGVPSLENGGTSIQAFKTRDEIVFYPRSQVREIFSKVDAVQEILLCQCKRCSAHSPDDRHATAKCIAAICDNEKPKYVLLAILTYLGYSFMIHYLARGSEPHDDALAFDQNVLDRNTWSKILDLDDTLTATDTNELNRRKSIFAENYSLGAALFDAPVFQIGEVKSWELHFEDHRRFPFVDDRYHDGGAFGEVWKFRIHPEYILFKDDVKLKSSMTRKNRVGQTFARKIIRGGTDPNTMLEWNLEQDILRTITAQHHEHIIELLFVYQWRQRIHFVFDFVESNLYQVLEVGWQPESADISESLRGHWLWKQFIGVCDGLATIHKPKRISTSKSKSIIQIGFHFDLKPKNILVRADGTLLISDFGQSLIKQMADEDASYGFRRGGSFIYQGPEACPNRKDFLDSGDADKIYRNYDIWSLACMMLEVIAYIREDGVAGTKALHEQHQREGGGPYYDAARGSSIRLKTFVVKKLKTWEEKQSSDLRYIQIVVPKLRAMFSIEPKSRPGSDELAKFLKSSLADTHDHDSVVIPDFVEGDIESRFSELYRPSLDGNGNPRSFLTIGEVNFHSPGMPSTMACHFRMYIDPVKNSIGISLLKGQESSKFVELLLAELHYLPLQLFQTTRVRCQLRSRNKNYALAFANNEVLQEFQDVLLGNCIAGLETHLHQRSSQPSTFSLSLVRIEWKGKSEPREFRDTRIELQIWHEWQRPHSHDYYGQQPTIGPRGPSPRILIFVLGSGHCINVPLYGNDKKMQFMINLKTNQPSRNVIIYPDRGSGFNDMGLGYIKKDQQNPCAMLPITKSAFINTEGRGCRKLILEFPDVSHRDSFKKIIQVHKPSVLSSS